MNNHPDIEFFSTSISSKDTNICVFYVDFEEIEKVLLTKIQKCFHKINTEIIFINKFQSILKTSTFLLTIEKNGWYDSQEKENEYDGYLSYKYNLLIVKMLNVSQEDFEQEVVMLSQELKKMNIRNVKDFGYDTKLNG